MRSGLVTAVAIGLTVLFLPGDLGAQRTRRFTARLTSMPVDPVTARTTAGLGNATAVLEGNTLRITGTFDGLNSPATLAHVHRAAKGLRGPKILDLTVTKATSGTIEGTFTLTPMQIDEIDRDRWYLQIDTERNSEGHLRGWLIK
jgi:hypothetical protein